MKGTRKFSVKRDQQIETLVAQDDKVIATSPALCRYQSWDINRAINMLWGDDWDVEEVKDSNINQGRTIR